MATDNHTQPFTLPPLAQMTSGIPYREDGKQTDVRDSGNWSMPSKHSSTVSSNPPLHLQTILNPDESPSNRFSASSGTPSSARYPSSLNGTLSPYSGHATTQGLHHLNQAYTHRDSTDGPSGTFLDSRRSSIDSSRVSMGIGQLAINNPSSPYESTNASRTSLASSLQQQRGIQTPVAVRQNGLSALSPSVPRPITRAGLPEKRAPPIMGPRSNVGGPDPTAAAPTPGFAWAFPDKADDEMSGSPASSRQNSIAASSTNTLETSVYAAHMQGLQPRSVISLQNDAANAMGSGNYSRTPELRVSHKLAERKRRSEMKDLFEQLNTILPNSPGSKSSKWEILSKAIDHVSNVGQAMAHQRDENKQLREELTRLRQSAEEAHAMEQELTAMYNQLYRLDPKGPHVYGPKTHLLAQQDSQNGQTAKTINHSVQPQNQPQQPQSHSMSNGIHQNQSLPQPQQSQQRPPQTSWSNSGSAPMQGVEFSSTYERR